MMHKDKLQRMLVLFRDLKYLESSMNPLLQQLLMAWTRNLVKKISLFLISEAVLLMYLFSQLIMESSKLLPLQETLILVVKILTKGLLIILLRFSKRRTMVLILRKIQEHSRNSGMKLRKQKEISQVFIK